MLDPKYGMIAGDGNLYTTEGTTVLPSFIDEDGKIVFDDDGFPEGANFFLDRRDGSAYFRGKVYATDGVFNGTVYATDGKFTGEIEATKGTFSGTIKAATLDGKLVGGANGGMLEGIGLNVGDGNFVVDRDGNVTMAGSINLSGGSITWGDNAPVKYQFGASITGPWHDTMQTNDKYRRDSLDGGTTWGNPYQFIGTDGRNGSDANVPSYIKQTYIDSVEIRSPTIKANDYYIYPYDEKDYTGTFNIHGMYGSKQYHMFQIAYQGAGDTPTVRLWSPDGAYMYIGDTSQMLYFVGILDLSGVSEIRWGNNAPKAIFA